MSYARDRLLGPKPCDPVSRACRVHRGREQRSRFSPQFDCLTLGLNQQVVQQSGSSGDERA